MNGRLRVLVVAGADEDPQAIIDQLDSLGFGVVWVPDAGAALAFLRRSPTPCLVVAGEPLRQFEEVDFVASVQRIVPGIHVITGVHTTTHQLLSAGGQARRSVSELPCNDELRRKVAELLAERLYPHIVASAVQSAALEVLGAIRDFRLESGAFLQADRAALSEVSAVIPFGGQLTGHLMVGMTRLSAQALHHVCVPQVASVRLDQMEDLVGELCNQILGRINAFFARHAVSLRLNTPTFIRAAEVVPRFPSGRPSFSVSLVDADDEARVSLEYYLENFEPEQLHAPVSSRALAAGEVQLF